MCLIICGVFIYIYLSVSINQSHYLPYACGILSLCVLVCGYLSFQMVERTAVSRRASVFDTDLYETCFLTHMCVFSLSFSLQCLSSYRTVSQWPLLLSFSLSL